MVYTSTNIYDIKYCLFCNLRKAFSRVGSPVIWLASLTLTLVVEKVKFHAVLLWTDHGNTAHTVRALHMTAPRPGYYVTSNKLERARNNVDVIKYTFETLIAKMYYLHSLDLRIYMHYIHKYFYKKT